MFFFGLVNKVVNKEKDLSVLLWLGKQVVNKEERFKCPSLVWYHKWYQTKERDLSVLLWFGKQVVNKERDLSVLLCLPLW